MKKNSLLTKTFRGKFIFLFKSYIKSCLTLIFLLPSFNDVFGQTGYIYVHNKTLNEESSTDFSFALSSTVSNSIFKTFNLNDNPNYILLGDLGASHTAASAGAVTADGELWAMGTPTPACCTNPNTSPNPIDPVHVTGPIYRRASGTTTWTKVINVTATAIDGAYANQCVYITSAGVFFYNGATNTTTTLTAPGSAAVDVTAGGGKIAIACTDGSIRTYSVSYTEGAALGGGGTWTTRVSGATANADRLDLKLDGLTIAYISGNTVKTVGFASGGPTNPAAGATVGSASGAAIDISYDENGILYAVAQGADTNPYVFNTLAGSSWTLEKKSQNTSRVTGGAGGMAWAIFGSSEYTGSFVNSILARMTDQNTTANGANAIWYDDERVHTATEGHSFAGIANTANNNSIMIPVPAGSYKITETLPDATWDLRRINVYDPTNNSSSSVVDKASTINVAAGEVVTLEYVNEKLVPAAIPNNCGINSVETFGAAAAAFGATPIQGTAYHYLNAADPEDGDYMLVHSLTASSPGPGNWFSTSALTNHTGDANGYFMLVNASYAIDEFYRKRVTGLAVGQTYTLSFWTANVSPSASVLPNVQMGIQDLSGTILGAVNTGNITATVWTQYSFTFVATVTTADIYLSNNSIGGDGNDLVIDDIAFNIATPNTPVPTVTSKASVCPANTVNLVLLQPATIANQTYEWHTVASNPTTANVVGDPTSVIAGSYYLYSKLTGTGCYSAVTSPVTTTVITCNTRIAGKVWNDVTADTTINISESGTNAGGLFVYLVDGTGKIIDKATVAADGTYALTGVQNTNYTLELTTNSYTIGTIPTIVMALPSGWVTTGENPSGSNAIGGGDAIADGKISINTGTAGKANQNFGIEQPPTAGSGSNIAVNPGGTISVVVPPNTFKNTTLSTDPGPGIVAGIRITSFPTNATSITINGITYNASVPADVTALLALKIPTDTLGNPTIPISIDPNFPNAGSSVISFKAIDDGGFLSANTGTATLNFGPSSVPITGTVINDINGNTIMNGVETGTTAGVPMYVYLIDAKGNIADSAHVHSDGTYALDGLTNTAYILKLSTVSYPIGTDTTVTNTNVTPPSGWVNTGENGTGSSDGKADGKLSVTTGTVPLTSQNFGIEQPPTAGAGVNSAVNPGGTISVIVPDNTFTNNTPSDDPGPGTVKSIRITSFPTNATSITVNGITYNAATPADVIALLALNIPTDVTGKPTVAISLDPIADSTVVSVIPFVTKDDAGLESTNIGTATMNFDAPIVISGTIIDDANGNTLKDGVEATTHAGTALFMYLVDAKGNIADSAHVLNDGSYSLNGLRSTNYSLILSAVSYPIGTDTTVTPINRTLPASWVTTGENGTGTSDGNPNGQLPLTTGTVNTINQNFGIEQTPIADPKSYSVAYTSFSSHPASFPIVNGYVGIAASSAALTGYASGGSLTGSDAEDCAAAGSCNSGKTFVINTVNSNTNLYYNFGTVGSPNIQQVIAGTATATIANFDPTKLMIYGRNGTGTTGTGSVGFTYSLQDAAGNKNATPVAYSITSATPLPLSLLSFEATNADSRVLLKWATTDEVNTSNFVVMHSIDGEQWNKVGVVNANGTSGGNYTFYHNDPAAGINYYQLEMFDNNGTYTVSGVRKVVMDSKVSVSVYPNPVTSTLHIATNDVRQISQIKVTDAVGKLIFATPMPASAEIDVSTLPAGIYDVSIRDANGSTKVFRVTK